MRRAQPAGPTLFGIDLTRALARFVINAIAILIASWVLPGIKVSDWKGVLFAAALFGLVNALIKPVVQFLTCPLYLLTLGLFAIVVNAVMLALTSWIAQQADIGFRVDGFGNALLGAIVIGIVSWLVAMVLTDPARRR
ncbi:MAG TPA: phage holin family protein [Dehalococcoidia bacterium]|nr:phage holin family protein [Dehalococcoidia bacterium]